MFPIKNIDEIVKETKALGEVLLPYTRPKVSQDYENDVNALRSKEIVIDGYHLVIFYSKSEWNDYFVEVLQMTGRYVPFLPFGLVCKIGKKFFGEKHLSYVDFIKDSQKTYCWTLATDKTQNPIPAPYREEILSNDCTYEGLCYKCLNPENF